MWGRFKSRFGWEARAFLIEWDGFETLPLLVLSRALAPGISFAYVPWGPGLPAGFLPENASRAAAELAARLRPFVSRNTIFIRFDPPWFFEESGVRGEPPLPFRRAAADIQPPDTVFVDLTPDESAILAAMKPKWRYNIGLAEKKGVAVTRPDEQGLDVFYKLLTETAARDGIAVHHKEYYKTLFEICAGGAEARLRMYTAYHENEPLAAIVVLCRGTQAVYLYGASSNNKRNLMAPYALQWQAMRDAKASGCALYDMFGIPPDDNPSHPMAGLYRFKTGFGGRIIHRPGSWDYPYRPFLCRLFTVAEGIRKKLRDRKKRGQK